MPTPWTQMWGTEQITVSEPVVTYDSHGAPVERAGDPRPIGGVDVQPGGSLVDTEGRTYQQWGATIYVDGALTLHPRAIITWRGRRYRLVQAVDPDYGGGIMPPVTTLNVQAIREGD